MSPEAEQLQDEIESLQDKVELEKSTMKTLGFRVLTKRKTEESITKLEAEIVTKRGKQIDILNKLSEKEDK